MYGEQADGDGSALPVMGPVIDALSGAPDPRSPAMAGDHVWTSVSFSPDDRYAYVGWSTRAAPIWHGGIEIVDIQAGSVTSRLDFPDMTAGDGDARVDARLLKRLGAGVDHPLLTAFPEGEYLKGLLLQIA